MRTTAIRDAPPAATNATAAGRRPRRSRDRKPTGRYRITGRRYRQGRPGEFSSRGTGCSRCRYGRGLSTVDRSDHWRSRTPGAMLVAAGPASSPVDVGPALSSPSTPPVPPADQATRRRLAPMAGQIGVAQRRARLAVRHRLARDSRAGSAVEVAADLVALHATDPATVHLSATARLREPDIAAVETALYEDRTLVRMLGMRRTVFVVPRDCVPVIQAACTDALAAVNRRRLGRLLVDSGVTDEPDKWLAAAGEATPAAPGQLGEAPRTELARPGPALRTP